MKMRLTTRVSFFFIEEVASICRAAVASSERPFERCPLALRYAHDDRFRSLLDDLEALCHAARDARRGSTSFSVRGAIC